MVQPGRKTFNSSFDFFSFYGKLKFFIFDLDL